MPVKPREVPRLLHPGIGTRADERRGGGIKCPEHRKKSSSCSILLYALKNRRCPKKYKFFI